MKIDFDINAHNIVKSEPVSDEELLIFRRQTKIDLPPSFIDFKKRYADSLYISSGNALSVFPLCEKKNSFANILSISKDYAHLGNIIDSHKLLIIGMSGVDSETWAFYTDKIYSDGEYPILWISPGEEKFFFHSTNFESFINIQYKSLSVDDSIDDYDEYYKSLIGKYDKHILPFGYDEIYSNAQDLAEISMIMSRT